MLTIEQLVAAQKANLEVLFELTNRAFEGIEKLVDLNMNVAKASLGELQAVANSSIAARDVQKLLALQADLLQPAAEKMVAYNRHIYDIASNANAEVTKLVESQLGISQARFTAAVESALRNAPAGTESAAALVKSAIATASNAVDTVHKASRQAAEVADANFQALSNSAFKAAQGASKVSRRTAA